MVKLDLEKAYDRTDWEFLDFVMSKKGFGLNGRIGIRVCFLDSLLDINQWIFKRLLCSNKGTETG